ncbi:putative casparian strip membrane protein [Helianthus annuus]|uniref:CASP-like protein n=1 Tax=Helianthus annuus TaxID=4232 RepID=A0A251STQ0_HELAN|nr:CASP-like protein 1 [Helianthus annuus]KAF5774147.1 putative casparian strip membrane protein [Helianthus annuus]KAJ0482028.1 putative casparian strip membrane protein [Helianthus annuus]KAJ0849954.1 putative casparian strip membrane protein [Helianthus annuus]KAJ0859009.1 putative casparian strip membrane protein [Helianthus annuus]
MSTIDTPEAPLKSSGAPEYSSTKGLVVDVALRVLLFATALVAIIVMVTSKQTKMIPVAPGLVVPMTAKFTQSPAFIYFIAAVSVACLYSIITAAVSVLALMRGGISTKMQFHFVMFDALLLGIVAAATGAAGGVAYIGYKGNTHTRWNKICNTHDSFCFHIASSLVLSLISSIALLLLVWLSLYVLSKKIARR